MIQNKYLTAHRMKPSPESLPKCQLETAFEWRILAFRKRKHAVSCSESLLQLLKGTSSHPTAIPQHLLEISGFSAEGKRPERVSARSLFCSKVAHSPGTVVMEMATAYRRVTRIFDMLPYFTRQSTLQEGQSSTKLSNINSMLPTFLKLFSCFCLNAWRSSSCADRKSPAEGFSSCRSLPGSYRTSKSELQRCPISRLGDNCAFNSISGTSSKKGGFSQRDLSHPASCPPQSMLSW